MKDKTNNTPVILDLLSPGGVAKLLNLSVSRVTQLDREGALPAMRDSAGRRYYHLEAVEAYASFRAGQKRERVEGRWELNPVKIEHVS